jgi:hypothetical protein
MSNSVKRRRCLGMVALALGSLALPGCLMPPPQPKRRTGQRNNLSYELLVDPDNILQGQTTTLRWTVENQGPEPRVYEYAEGPVMDVLALSNIGRRDYEPVIRWSDNPPAGVDLHRVELLPQRPVSIEVRYTIRERVDVQMIWGLLWLSDGGDEPHYLRAQTYLSIGPQGH